MLKQVCSILLLVMLGVSNSLAAPPHPAPPPAFTIPAKERIVIYAAYG